MNKIVIFVLILSFLLTLIYYLGFIRYLMLYINPLEKYINSYKHLDKTKSDKKVIISLSTTPANINKHMDIMLKSILNQTVKVDQIVLNIPKLYKDKKYVIPDNYKNILNIFTSGRDYGISGTKLIPTLLRENDSDSIILLLDDNIVYGEDFIETIINESISNKDKCIYTNNSILVKPGFFDETILNRDGNINNNFILDNLKVDKIKLSYFENYSIF